MIGAQPALQVSDLIAEQLADPHRTAAAAGSHPWWPHHLGHGAAGITLLHAERAAAGAASWDRLHDWLSWIARTTITSGADSHLNYGAPAVAFAMSTVAAHLPGAYRAARDNLDATITADTLRRVEVAGARLFPGRRPLLADFDVVRGITGVTAYLLRHRRDSPAIPAALSYLVRLTKPVTGDGVTVPGWWTSVSPHGELDDAFPGGHANTGVAHGIAGPLALLSLARRAEISVPGQVEAITTICTWLDQWQHDVGTATGWPYWVTRQEHRAGPGAYVGRARRPSWCYGTAGVARAQQLAALALDDPGRRRRAEQALLHALNDPAHRREVCDPSLCHGYAGMAHLAVRVAADADPNTAGCLHAAAAELLDAVHHPRADPERTVSDLLNADGPGPGLLEGAAGVALAARSAATARSPSSSWDTCLLIA